jgi:L-alanine-DL-glutamate epimerase-like enolase superfamily enzyme
LAPHCWGSALSFAAGASLAFASPAARVIEFSLGANPFLHELFCGVNLPVDGTVAPPSASGFGCDPVPDIVDRYTVGAVSVSNATGGSQ